MHSFLVFFSYPFFYPRNGIMFYSFGKNILNSYCVAGTVLDTEDSMVTETSAGLPF